MIKAYQPPEPSPIIGIKVEGYSVGAWYPTPDQSGPPEAVTFEMKLPDCLRLVLVRPNGEQMPLDQDLPVMVRLKSAAAVDRLIEALQKEKKLVFGT